MIVVYYPNLAKVQDLYVEKGILPRGLSYDELMEAKPLLVFDDYLSCFSYEKQNSNLSKFLTFSVQISKPYGVIYWCYYNRYSINSLEELKEPCLTSWEEVVIKKLISYNSKLPS